MISQEKHKPRLILEPGSSPLLNTLANNISRHTGLDPLTGTNDVLAKLGKENPVAVYTNLIALGDNDALTAFTSPVISGRDAILMAEMTNSLTEIQAESLDKNYYPLDREINVLTYKEFKDKHTITVKSKLNYLTRVLTELLPGFEREPEKYFNDIFKFE